jgi:hypothetical protein
MKKKIVLILEQNYFSIFKKHIISETEKTYIQAYKDIHGKAPSSKLINEFIISFTALGGIEKGCTELIHRIADSISKQNRGQKFLNTGAFVPIFSTILLYIFASVNYVFSLSLDLPYFSITLMITAIFSLILVIYLFFKLL